MTWIHMETMNLNKNPKATRCLLWEELSSTMDGVDLFLLDYVLRVN